MMGLCKGSKAFIVGNRHVLKTTVPFFRPCYNGPSFFKGAQKRFFSRVPKNASLLPTPSIHTGKGHIVDASRICGEVVFLKPSLYHPHRGPVFPKLKS